MSETITRTCDDVTVSCHLNEKAQCDVQAIRSISDDVTALLAVGHINPVHVRERKRFVEEIADEADRELVLGLLREIADDVVIARTSKRDTASTSNAANVSAKLDVEPWPEPVDGSELLSEVSAHIDQYLYLPRASADAIAAWSVLTHCREWLAFAPLLIPHSSTKRCGKTNALVLMTPIVRRGRLTSATGITPAVVFRLNERDHPTFCIDEAEKLKGRHADPDLVGLINHGYRKGGKHSRCVEKGGSFDVQDFDVFGFRALALIGKPWDTIADRAILVEMQRKPKGATVARFRESVVERTGLELARKARRWTTDEAKALREALDEAPRPVWLGDRDCDNWAGLFAIAAVAGDKWPQRIEHAARVLAGSREDDGDLGERLIHDVRTIFNSENTPPVIASGELLQKLNGIETSQWGDERDGRGLSTHSLARKLKPFGISPRLDRHPETHTPTRGYWLSDLTPVFERYPVPDSRPGNTVTLVTVAEEGTPGATEQPPASQHSANEKHGRGLFSAASVTTVTPLPAPRVADEVEV